MLNGLPSLLKVAGFHLSLSGWFCLSDDTSKTFREEGTRGWAARNLKGKRYVYWWADGIYFKVRLSDERPLLVIMGTLEDEPRSWWPSRTGGGRARSPGGSS